MGYAAVCSTCAAVQPVQVRGRPRARCARCGERLDGQTSEVPDCAEDGCSDAARLTGRCTFHTAVQHAASRPVCVTRGCDRHTFLSDRCHVHTRVRYRRYLPPRTPEQIEEELVGRGLLRAWRRWRERRWRYGPGGHQLAPVYRLGKPNRLLATILALLWDGQCHLCGGPIDADTPVGHPLALTVDHVRPRAQGGVHVITNLAPAHLICNIIKGDRLTVRQPRVRVPMGRLRGARKATVVVRDRYGRRVGRPREWR